MQQVDMRCVTGLLEILGNPVEALNSIFPGALIVMLPG